MNASLADLPEPQRAAIADAVAAAFGAQPLEALVPLHGGLSAARVYRVVVGGVPYLLRITGERDAFSDPVRHHACLRAAAAAGLAPRVLHTDDAHAIVITDFIAAQPMASCPPAHRLAELAALVRRLQALPRFPPLIAYLDEIDGFVARLRADAVLPAHDVFERYAALSAAYPRAPETWVSAHNDLNPGNVLWDGTRLWLIDWESAFANDPYADPAHVCNDLIDSPADEAGWLAAYFGAPPTPYQHARLWLMRQVVCALQAALLLNLARAARPALRLTTDDLAAASGLAEHPPRRPARVHTPDDQIHRALDLLGRLDAATRSPRFTEAIQIIRDAPG